MHYRHMIHLMLGDTYAGAVCNLMGYVLSYEDKDLSDVFTGMLCTRGDNGSLIFKTTQRIVADSSGELQFNSEPVDPFKVELKEDTVIGSKDQLDHLKNFFSGLFNKRVTINRTGRNREAVLNICIYLPMYDEEKWKLAKLLIKAISEQNRNINVDLFLLSSDLAYLFTPADKQADLPTDLIRYEKLGQAILKDAVAYKENIGEAKRLGHVIVMQNCNAEGLSLDLDWGSFVRIIGEFAIATMNSYNEIFQPNAEMDGRPIHSFGLCVLNLDKYYYVKYLLSKAYVTILEREGVNQDDIDVNIPSQIVQQALTGDDNRYKFYDRFYEHRVKGYIAEGKSEEEINAQAMKDIDGDIERLILNVTAFLNDETMSLPSKRVTLAQLLGMDDELMSGDMFNPNQLLFRDSYADCIEMFVKANNLLVRETPAGLYVDIPGARFNQVEEEEEEEQGESEEKEGKEKEEKEKKKAPKDDARPNYPEVLKTYAALGTEEIDFAKLCKELKSEEVKIRRQTEYIRTLEKDLQDCHVQTQQSEEKDKVLTKDGFRYGDKTYKVDKIETIPLEKTYKPKTGKLPKSVDLRRNFPLIKDQGAVGSCTSFALVSIFEHILSKRQMLESALSERYLYYNTRIEALRRAGHPDDPITEVGTSFFDAIKALQGDGLCRESLCPYTADGSDINVKPSEEAYEDGRRRLVTEAMNVDLTEQAIKSALNEGYPVAVSVRLFNSFGNPDHGFIALPDDAEVQQADDDGIESNHAMVICGYSDENKVFVVRNSWGTSFAEKGYCYMPYSYITDPHLTNQACIITGTNVVSADKVKDGGGISHEVVPFDKLNPEINAAIIKVLIGEARKEKAELIRHRTELYTAYTLLEKRLVNSEVRSTLTAGTKERLKWEIAQIHRQKNENEEAEDRRIKALDRQNRKVNIYFILSLVLLLIIGAVLAKSVIYRLILKVIPMTKIFLLLFACGLIAMGVWWWTYLKRRKAIQKEHSEIGEELETMEHARESGGAGNGGNLGLYNRALGIRMFMPWLVIRKLSERNRQLEQKYQVMVNYTLNLREWYDTEKSKVGTMNPDTREPFISLLSNETLDKYYSKHAEEITQGIKLSALFKDGYSINDSAIVAFQNKLKDRIIGVLDESLKGFSVYKYLTGKTDFEFTKERKFDIHEMLNSLEGRSQVFIRIGASPYTDETINSTTTVLMSSDINQDIATWNNEFQRDFTVPVSHIDIMSPFKLSFLQMRRLPLEECLDLYNPNVPQWQETEEEPDPLPVVPPEEEEEVTVEENAPVEDAPVEDTPADTEEEAPAEEEVTPTEEEVTPAEEEEVPAEEELAPAEKEAPAEEEVAPAEEEAPTEEEVVPAEEEVAPAEEEVAPAEEEEVPTEGENPQEPAEEESPKQ